MRRDAQGGTDCMVRQIAKSMDQHFRPCALNAQSSSTLGHAESLRSTAFDAEHARAAAEEARRAKLCGIMACIRDVQKRNDATGR